MNKIYKLTNNVNSKVYIGQTWFSLKHRLAQHLCNKVKSKLTNAIEKHGKEAFHIELITVSHTQEVADYWEKYFIEKFDSIKHGYNIKDGGSRGKQSESTKQKISKKAMGHKRNLGRVASEQAKQNISNSLLGSKNPMFGKHISNEVKQRISDAHFGKARPIEVKKKISDSMKATSKSNKGKTWKVIDGKRVWLENKGK